MKTKLTLIFSIILSFQIMAQQSVETKLEYNYTTTYSFTDEWQYLTTDIYLFNCTQFTRVINELSDKIKLNKKKEYFEHLFISAKLKNVKLFGNEEIIYPLYNYQIDNSQKTSNAIVAAGTEVVRVIDKLPLSSGEENIDAEIKVEAVTNNNSNQIIGIVAGQLLNLSTLTNPTKAVMSLVGEFGNLIESNTKKRQYKFSSTIRLYEGEKFDMKLHSVRLYILIPTGTEYMKVKVQKLVSYLENNENPKIDSKVLEELLTYNEYPILIAVNYKSLYKMDPLTGDEISTEVIEKRKAKVENAKEQGLIKNEPYLQEKNFIEFLVIFNNLKNSINLYNLNYEINNTEAFSKNLFIVYQDYAKLKSMFNNRLQTFKNNNTFVKLFKKEYEQILQNADIYLDKDQNLRSCKELVNSSFDLQTKNISSLSAEERENYLRKLNTIDFSNSDFVNGTSEGQQMNKMITELERIQVIDMYEPMIKELDIIPANESNLTKRNVLRDKAKQTYCKTCKNLATEALQRFNDKYELSLVKKAESKKDSAKEEADMKLIEFLKKKDCITSNINKQEIIEALGSGKERILEKIDLWYEKVEMLKTLVDDKTAFTKLTDLEEYINQLEVLVKKTEEGFTKLCILESKLCDCQ